VASIMYAIEVPDGAKPGDPIKVRLPDGVTVVKITVPEGAGPGTTLEFELPSEEASAPAKAPAPAPAPEKHDEEPTAVPARLHSEEKAKLTADGDLTNAVGEKIYVITLPAGVVPGKPIVAEIMDGSGATVLVPVPRGARAGRELLFRVQGGLEDEAAPKEKVYRKGSLKKVSPKSSALMIIWQTRWFELSEEKLLYWDVSKPDGVEKKGSVPVSQLVGVRMHQNDKYRFDLLLANKRLFQLKAPSEKERELWGQAMQKALVDAAAALSGGGKKPLEDMTQLSDAVDDAAMSIREDSGDLEEKEPEKKEEKEEDEEDEEEEEVEEIGQRTKSQFVKIDSKVDKAADPEPVGEIQAAAAAPVIETAVYMSRVERARLANAAKKAS